MPIIAGSTPKILITIKDSNGLQLDPSNASQVTEVKILLFNSLTGAIIGKFYLNTQPTGEGWVKMTTKIMSSTDVRVLMVLSAAQTIAGAGCTNTIQINTHVPDTDVPDTNQKIIIKRGKFHEIEPAKTE